MNKERTTYFKQTETFFVSMMFILPMLVLYEVGLFLLNPPYQNGIGAIFKILIRTMGTRFDTTSIIVINSIVILILIIAYFRSKKTGGIRALYFFTMLIESTAYAIVLAMFAFLFTNISKFAHEYLNLSVLIATDSAIYNKLTHVVYAIGAGLYEEIFFRLGLLNLLLLIISHKISKTKVSSSALLSALLISSILFAFAHGIGDASALSWKPMLFRTISGMFFGIVFILRGLSVAVYMHIIYDLIIFIM
ncbi:MAG: CPBP family intramembrane metalloprotease [Planctomycetes bacterium]|nr:CPBP family intramembrane metalloprotease [Planctomycetota bacterium]